MKGKISVGIAHPLYDKEVDLIVLEENAGYDRRGTRVKTAEKVYFRNNFANVFRKGKFVGTIPLPDRYEYVEGWLVRV